MLPTARTPLVGRESDISRALGLLRRRDVRLVTLSGAGRVGKSRLAIEVARAARDDFADDVGFVSLDAVDDPALVAAAIARGVGVGEAGDRTAFEQMTLYLQERELLLVLDLGWIASFRSPANQAAQVSLVSGDATAHEDSVLSVDVDNVDAAYALAQATGLRPDYGKCQAHIADVHRAFRSGS